MYQIEDVAVETVRAQYPWAEMKVGQSIVAGKAAISSATAYGKRHGMKFASRKLGDDSFRVGRVE